MKFPNAGFVPVDLTTTAHLPGRFPTSRVRVTGNGPLRPGYGHVARNLEVQEVGRIRPHPPVRLSLGRSSTPVWGPNPTPIRQVYSTSHAASSESQWGDNKPATITALAPFVVRTFKVWPGPLRIWS